MSGFHILVISLTEIYYYFYSRRNLIDIIWVLSVVYQHFVIWFQNHGKVFHFPLAYKLSSHWMSFPYLIYRLFKKNATQHLVPSSFLYGLHYGIYYPHIVDYLSFPIYVKFFPLFIQFQKCGIIFYFGSITFDWLNNICYMFCSSWNSPGWLAQRCTICDTYSYMILVGKFDPLNVL